MSISVRVIQDMDAMSPRDYDNLGLMACWHRRYNLGDVQPKDTPEEWLKSNAPSGSIILPLFLYDHSGITMNTKGFSCPWDSGKVGVIVATPDKIRASFGKKRITKKVREAVIKWLIQEVETYDHYLTNNVWGYDICGTDDTGNEVSDSCFGFYGDDVEGMKEHIDSKYHDMLQIAWDNLSA
jgi:hypothetical protein